MNPRKLYRECLGKLSLRQAWANLLYVKWDALERRKGISYAGRFTGSGGTGYEKLLKACLRAVGEDGDYIPGYDDGEEPKQRIYE